VIRRIALLCVVLAAPVFGQTTVNGAGATFPNPMYQKWFSEYHKAHPDIQFNYHPSAAAAAFGRFSRRPWISAPAMVP